MNNYGDQYDVLKHYIVQPSELVNTIKVTIPTDQSDVPRPFISKASDAGSFSAKRPKKFSEATTRYFSKWDPPIDLC